MKIELMKSQPAWQQPSQSSQAIERFQPIRISRRGRRRNACLVPLLAICAVPPVMAIVLLVYLLAPYRTTFLMLGIDRVPDGSAVGRSDTMVLVSVSPLQPAIQMLSIPRDLWVNIPGVGEQRINTAHFFAEANQPGSGPAFAAAVVEQNFKVKVPYTIRIKFDGFMQIIDALGGVTIDMPEDMSGYSAGEHHLDSEKALAFIRDRQGTDDFYRMSRGQLLIRSVIHQCLKPQTWPRLPGAAITAFRAIDTNLPFWEWPRLTLAFLRSGTNGINSQVIGREYVTPFTTTGGANVLLPNWDKIHPIIDEMFSD